MSDRWNTDLGLPQNSVNAVVQSGDGYVWIATLGGLARFDGTTFTVYSGSQQSGLPSDRVLSLAEDAEGRMWVGTESGLARYASGRFVPLPLKTDLGSAIVAIAAHPDGSLWVGTRGGGLARVTDDKVEVVMPRGGALGGLSAVRVDAEGAVWVSAETGIWRFDAATRDGRQVLPRRRTTAATAIAADAGSGGGIWAVTDSGVVHLTGAGAIQYPVRRRLGDPRAVCRPGPDCGPWRDNVDITAVLSTGAGMLWLGTRAGEVWRFRTDSGGARGALVRVKDGEAGPTTALFADREGGLWAGSGSSGLAHLRPALFRMLTQADGLAGDITAAVFADHDGRIWAGANCGGVSIIDTDRVRVLTRRDGLRNECVWSLGQDSGGGMWIGTYGGGVGRWLNGRMAAWYTVREGLPSNVVLAILAARDGTVWIGTDRGLMSWDGRELVRHDGPVHADHPDVRVILEARDGSLWLGTQGGLVHYAHGTFSRFTTADGLPNDYVRAIIQDSSGALWLGTYGGGLGRYAGGRFTSFTTTDGLYDNVVSSLIDDGAGQLWMSSNRGVFRVPRHELEAYAAGRVNRLHCVVYNRADGMLSSETNGGFQPAVARGRDGRLWYPTVKGIAGIDPAAARPNPVAPAVMLTSLSVAGRDVPLAGSVTIPPGATDVAVDYAGLSFVAPNAVTFRYRLAGWDRDWVEAGTRRSAYYSRLGPGHYWFEVAAANRDGVWSAAPAQFALNVRPFVWQTWWFKTLAVLLFAGLLFGTYRARISQVRRTAMVDALREMSLTDELTGLYNRRGFLTLADQITAQAHRGRREFHVVFVDMDGMKKINDSFGHEAGDRALRDTAQLLKLTFREADVIGRLGGDEFAVLMVDAGSEEAEAAQGRLLERLAARNAAGGEFSLNLSVGISRYDPLDPLPISELVTLADQRMYAQKRGKGATR